MVQWCDHVGVQVFHKVLENHTDELFDFRFWTIFSPDTIQLF